MAPALQAEYLGGPLDGEPAEAAPYRLPSVRLVRYRRCLGGPLHRYVHDEASGDWRWDSAV